MSDTPPPPPAPPTGGGFCAECGAAMPADARFCGSCGAPPPDAASGSPSGGADPTVVSGGAASTWQGVAPIVERPTDAIPSVPPGAGGPPPAGPPPGAPPVGGPPPTAPVAPTDKKGKGPLVLVLVVILALLAGGAFFLTSGGDDDNDDERAQDEETTTTEDQDEETTTTEAADDETTTTAADDVETTTTAPVVDDGDALGFQSITDDSGRLLVDVPDFWEVDGRPLGDGSPNIQAAESIADFVTFNSSGLSYTLLSQTNVDPNVTMDFLVVNNNLAACTAQERLPYDDQVFVGLSQIFTGCPGAGASVVEIVGSRADGLSVEVTIALVPEDDPEIVSQIQRSFLLSN